MCVAPKCGIVDTEIVGSNREEFMKLIHLSDLHLGKRVNEFSMIEDQKYILNEILRIIDE